VSRDSRSIGPSSDTSGPAVSYFARCTGTADVIAANRFARDHDLEVAVRAGGHNVAGPALSEGGLVIDLQPMKGIRVDPARRTRFAQPGLRLGEVDHETQAFGLALGGGIGWQMRKHGVTIDHLVSADVVTAGGEVLQASAERNPDLISAIRGGGGIFGIVIACEFNLVPLGPAVYGGVVLYPAERAPDVLRAYRDWAADASDEVTTILLLRRNAFPWARTESQGRPIPGSGALYAGPAEAGERALAPLQRLGPVLASSIQRRLFTQHQSMLDASARPGGSITGSRTTCRHSPMPASTSSPPTSGGSAHRFRSPCAVIREAPFGGGPTRRPRSPVAMPRSRSTSFAPQPSWTCTSGIAPGSGSGSMRWRPTGPMVSQYLRVNSRTSGHEEWNP
jgi:FAD/FMN-containing dehydrogenase